MSGVGDKDQPYPFRRIIQKSNEKQTCPPITYTAKFICPNFPCGNYKIKSRVRRALMTYLSRMRSLEILNVSQNNMYSWKEKPAGPIHTPSEVP